MDLANHLKRQIAFSRGTFGPGARAEEIFKNVEREISGIRQEASHPDRVEKWVDVVILAFDGLTRELVSAGYTTESAAQQAVAKIASKQTLNEAHDWPDWRKADTDTMGVEA